MYGRDRGDPGRKLKIYVVFFTFFHLFRESARSEKRFFVLKIRRATRVDVSEVKQRENFVRENGVDGCREEEEMLLRRGFD
jgi:hypothetical protein